MSERDSRAPHAPDEEFTDADTGPIEFVDVQAVGAAVRPHIKPTTFLSTETLDAVLGTSVRIASETFQLGGSFKIRAALAAALHSPAAHLLAASSGNFGAALAMAARHTGKKCTVVMPSTSARVKIEAVRRYGATVDLVDTATTPRLERAQMLAAELGDAQLISAYDDPYVIAGNATLGDEIFAARTDVVVVPVGGGGLSSGIVLSRNRMAKAVEVVGAEPLLANDAARSLRAGVLVRDEQESTTICDGARSPALGQRNFAILRRGLSSIVEVTEENVANAMRLLFSAVNLKVEPTGALAVAAVLQEPQKFAGKRVTCVVSGGNVDAELYARILRG
jgi:threonine dehydratase